MYTQHRPHSNTVYTLYSKRVCNTLDSVCRVCGVCAVQKQNVNEVIEIRNLGTKYTTGNTKNHNRTIPNDWYLWFV